jgi:hypothetical protein
MERRPATSFEDPDAAAIAQEEASKAYGRTSRSRHLLKVLHRDSPPASGIGRSSLLVFFRGVRHLELAALEVGELAFDERHCRVLCGS